MFKKIVFKLSLVTKLVRGLHSQYCDFNAHVFLTSVFHLIGMEEVELENITGIGKNMNMILKEDNEIQKKD